MSTEEEFGICDSCGEEVPIDILLDNEISDLSLSSSVYRYCNPCYDMEKHNEDSEVQGYPIDLRSTEGMNE